MASKSADSKPQPRAGKPRPKRGITQLPPRIVANRKNGAKGGLATARNHDQEWLQARASHAGMVCKLKYGSGYYSHITRQQIADGKHKGWPKGTPRPRIARAIA